MLKKTAIATMFCCLMGCGGLSCSPPSPTPTVVKVPEYEWRTLSTVGNEGTTDGWALVLLNNLIIDCGGTGMWTGRVSILAKNVETGEKVWEWSDWIAPDGEIPFADGMDVPVHNDIALFVSNGSPGPNPQTWAAINLKTGQTVWKRTNTFSSRNYSVFGFEQYYYYVGRKAGMFHGLHVVRGEIETGHETVLMSYTLLEQNETPMVKDIPSDNGYWENNYTSPRVWRDGASGDLMLLASVNKGAGWGSDWYTSYLVLINLSQNKIIYKNTVVEKGTYRFEVEPMQIVDGKVVMMVNDALAVAELSTGKVLWSYDLKSLVVSAFTMHEGRIYIVPQKDGYLHCFDLATGEIKYIIQQGGGGQSIENIVVADGKVFYASTGSGRLFVHKASTGELLWKLQSPDARTRENNYVGYSGEHFNGKLVVVGDKLYARGYRATFCYKLSAFDK